VQSQLQGSEKRAGSAGHKNMMEKLIRRFASQEEFKQEFEANLKNFGLFIPGEFQLELRQKVQVEIWLPDAEQAFPAKAEVVAVFPSGIALHLEEPPDWLRKLEEKISATRTEPVEALPAQEELSEEDKKELEQVEEIAVSEEDVEKIEKKIAVAESDMSNLYQAIRKLSKIEKIQLAKRGNRKALSILIQQGDRMLFRFLIQNPHLSASEVLQLFKHPALTTENIQELARNPVWAQNEEIRYQMVIHPKTPLPTALSLLNGVNQKQLAAIAKSQHIRAQLKSNALKLLLKRQSSAF